MYARVCPKIARQKASRPAMTQQRHGAIYGAQGDVMFNAITSALQGIATMCMRACVQEQRA